jgi:hypothetical protein
MRPVTGESKFDVHPSCKKKKKEMLGRDEMFLCFKEIFNF